MAVTGKTFSWQLLMRVCQECIQQEPVKDAEYQAIKAQSNRLVALAG